MSVEATMKWLGNWSSTVVTLLSIAGMVYAFNTVYAKDEDLKKVEARVEQKILFDRHDALEQRQWKQSDRYGSEAKMPPDVKEEYRRNQQEMGRIKKALDGYSKFNNSTFKY